MENGQNMLQTVANTVENTMENERFELKTVAHTVEMAVSSSKMLQIGMENGENRKSKKNSPNKKKNPQTISYPFVTSTPRQWSWQWSLELSNMAGKSLNLKRNGAF